MQGTDHNYLFDRDGEFIFDNCEFDAASAKLVKAFVAHKEAFEKTGEFDLKLYCICVHERRRFILNKFPHLINQCQ